MSRYDRQERIPNWNQQKLNNARVAIVGAGNLGSMVALALSGLGAGRIRIYDNSKSCNQILERCINGSKYKVENIENLVSAVNPALGIRGIKWRFMEHYFASIINNPSVIIHCGNDSYEKLVVSAYGLANNIPVINGASKKNRGALSIIAPHNFNLGKEWYKSEKASKKVYSKLYESYLLTDFHSTKQDNLTSLIMAGIISDEVRKIIMPIFEEEKPLRGIFDLNLESENRFDKRLDFNRQPYDKNKEVWVVGAGSIGNVIGLGLAAENIERVVIFDDDEVEEVNLNRQILFYDSIGEPKSKALAEKLKRLNPKIDVKYNVRKFTMDEKGNPSLLLACTDSFKSRKLIHDYALKHKVPAIFGGTDFDSGQALTYIPGKTTCINCQLDINKLAEEERIVEAEHCTHVPEPSVIISNWLIAALMTSEIGAVFNPDNKPINGRIGYDSRQARRLGVINLDNICNCHEEAGQ